jgi:hypothetical protein
MTSSPARDHGFTHGIYTALAHGERLDEISGEFALEPAETSDALLDLLTGDAIRERRLQDATFLQRVKFRSRMLRALARGARARPS